MKDTKKCKNCSKEFKIFKTTDKWCSQECFKEGHVPNLKLKSLKPINKVSEKRKEINKIYESVRIEVLTEAKFKCFIDGCTNVANTIEHTAGRIGFYDEEARNNNTPLVIDKRFLKACCLHHNGELENNPELSRKYQLSKITGKPKEEK